MLFWNRWNQESGGRVYFNISREKPAHTPDTPHVQQLSCKLEWTNQKHLYCFSLKPIRDNLGPGFPRALDLSPRHVQKSSGSRLGSRAEKRLLMLMLSFRLSDQWKVWVGNGGNICLLDGTERRNYVSVKGNSLTCWKYFKGMFVYSDSFRWQTNSGKRRFFAETMAALGEYACLI